MLYFGRAMPILAYKHHPFAAKTIKKYPFLAKMCHAVPIFVLQEDHIFIVGRLSHPPPLQTVIMTDSRWGLNCILIKELLNDATFLYDLRS